MVKVLDPDGTIIGAFENKESVPEKVWNRFCTYAYPKDDLDIVEVTDPKDIARLQKTLERCKEDYAR